MTGLIEGTDRTDADAGVCFTVVHCSATASPRFSLHSFCANSFGVKFGVVTGATILAK